MNIKNITHDAIPYIDHTGDIVIPINADSKYHFWNGGQPLPDTVLELNAAEDAWNNYLEKPYPGNAA